VNVDQVVNEVGRKAFFAQRDPPHLMAFPRTGSHWLRMMMEIAFELPSLKRVFLLKHGPKYLLYHTHDLLLKERPQNVIYLWRDPVDVVYSHIAYKKEGFENVLAITAEACRYGQHLNKWMVKDDFTTKKTVIRYEEMKEDAPAVLERVAEHLGIAFDRKKAEDAAKRTTRKVVSDLTQDDDKIVCIAENYAEERLAFRKQHEDLIWEHVQTCAEWPELAQYRALAGSEDV
jgi:hypothetical protein